MTWQRELKKIVKGRLKFNEPLSKHTTWKVGGCAEALAEPNDLADLTRIIKFSYKNKLPLLVIGAGSNLLICDKGIKGIVLRLSKACFKNIGFKGNFVLAGCGLGLNRLVNLTKNKGLSGVEFLSGIPGTLGGALVMNAGIKDASISDLVKEVTAIDLSARKKVFKKSSIKFAYRSSNLAGYIVLSAKLKLKPQRKEDIESIIRKLASYKKNIQDLKSRNAGCVFKNPLNNSAKHLTAGKMIDICGLKGRRIGGAEVSRIHANFILNKNRAKASDIFKLMSLIQKRVKQKFNVLLKPEVKLIGKF